MKRFKLIIALLVCCLVMCPLFAGCSGDGASYVKGSAKCSYEFNTGNSYSYLNIKYSFKVDVEQAGDYTVNFDLEVYKDDTSKENLLETYNRFLSFSIDGADVRTLNGEIFEDFKETPNLKFVINNVKIYRQKESNDYTSYAIGFGAAGGALLCGITVYFIVDKLVLSKKKDN